MKAHNVLSKATARTPPTTGEAGWRSEMGHNYHQHCGCASCDMTEEAWEAREEYITDNAPEAAKLLMVSPDFAWSAIADLPNQVLCDFAEDLGRFFEDYHAGTTDSQLANAGYRLYRTLRPYVEAAAEAQAMRDLADRWDATLQEAA